MEDKVQQYIGEVRTNKSGNDLLRKIGDNLWILISKEQYDTEKEIIYQEGPLCPSPRCRRGQPESRRAVKSEPSPLLLPLPPLIVPPLLFL